MSTDFTVSVVIPTYNRKEKLLRLIETIYQSDFPRNMMEIIVVDNGSMDGTHNAVVRKFQEVIYLQPGTNLMCAGARDYGTKRSSGKYIFFIDDDNIVDQKCLSTLVRFFEKKPNVGIAAPLMLEYDEKETVWCAGGKLTKYGKCLSLYSGFKRKDLTLSEAIYDVDYFPNFYAVRRQLSDGGLWHDTKNFPHNWSELDYCIRAQKMGYKLATVINAKTWHDHNDLKTNKSFITRISLPNAYDQPRSRILFIKKHQKSFTIRLYYYGFLIPVAAAYAMCQFCFQKNGTTSKLMKNYIKGYLDGFRSNP